MRKFKTLIVGSLAVAGLAFAGCEKRADNTDLQARGTTESAKPADRVPSDLDKDKQPVSGTESGSAVPSSGGSTATGYGTANESGSPTAPGMGSTATGATAATAGSDTDLYWTSDDGSRHMLHDSALITQVQQKLSTSGAYTGPTDGKTSPELTAAIRDFQKKQGLQETGTIDRKTADAMGLDWSKFSADHDKTLGETAEGARQDFERGAKKVGTEIEAGANKAAGEIQEGARDLKREVEETTK